MDDLPLPGSLNDGDKHRLVRAVCDRYEYMRDNGHEDFIQLAERCQQFWWGEQWEAQTLARLKAQRRPAITVNQILQTVDMMAGEQIQARNEIRFRPRYGQTDDSVATALNKVFKHISQGNDLTWLRTDVFEDGNITGRGFYEVRLDFEENLFGEVKITALNSKDVLVDPDATQYDPRSWNDVIISNWKTPMEVELLYGKDVADKLRTRLGAMEMGHALDDQYRDRFSKGSGRDLGNDDVEQAAYVRVVDRQWKVLVKREFWADTRTGELRAIPDDWDEARRAQYQADNPEVVILERIGKRVRWTVVAGDELAFDGWSPYEHFTVVPYFPHFRSGHTVGVVEQLLGLQELLNKTVSQELHVVNTTANSGWKVKAGSLQNMTTDELEARGAQSGLVLELAETSDAEKIQPNSIPTGLDNLANKAETYIKAVSGITDYMRGDAREDVSGRALQANQQRGQVGLARVLDNLNRSDVFLARVVLSMVQSYYVEERLLYITGAGIVQDETVAVNQVTPEGTILNDLTVGEYLVTVESAPARESLEDSQFEQAKTLKELGLPIPDDVLIQNSRLLDKSAIIESMQKASQSPEAQMQQQIQLATLQAELAKLQSEAQKNQADAQNKSAQANVKNVQAQTDSLKVGMDVEQQRAQIEQQRVDIEARRLALEEQKQRDEVALKQQELANDREKIRLDAVTNRIQAQAAMKSASQPTKTVGDTANA